MRNLIFIALAVLLLSAHCKKENNDCHHTIYFTNNSSEAVIPARKIQNTQGECILSGEILAPGMTREFKNNSCWEEELNVTSFELYVVDTSLYNENSNFYSCDSIDDYNLINHHYLLNKENLKSLDFRITYP